jgi:hypothetical protein
VNITLKTGVYHAQAYGCWLYVQIGTLALFCGRRAKRGLRIVWKMRKYYWRPRVRLMRFNQMPADTTYGTWLKKQTDTLQDDVLGPTRGRLLREGKFTADFRQSKGEDQ